MQGDELKILLALESSWTISLNGSEFAAVRSEDIVVNGTSLVIGKVRRKIVAVEWLRHNIVRVRTASRLRSRSEVLTFYPGANLPPGVHLRKRRRLFQTMLAGALTDYFGGRHDVQQLLHNDKTHGIGTAYSRFTVGNRAAIAVDPDEPDPVVNGVMRAAIFWSARERRRISIVIPAERSITLATRLRAMPKLAAQFDWLQWNGKRIEPFANVPQLETQVHDYVRPDCDAEVARICALAPDLLQVVPYIAANGVAIRLRGLDVARINAQGTTYPMGEPLEPLIELLAKERRLGSRHPLARAYEERWLESSLIRQIQDLLPVRSEWIYPQVPSFSGEKRSIIDLLAITSAGRLVVIEVKASADPDLPFQALDYWLAVERHRQAGDFSTRGYFPGMKISDLPALLIVVAPLLEFHRSVDRLAALLPEDLPLCQIGINQTWKREIKILRRKGTLG